MVKIIKPGKLRVAKCKYCECEFSYEKEDIHYLDPGDDSMYVTCPCCTKIVIVDG